MDTFDAGIFTVDKPPGPSSFAMVKKVRSLLGIKKVGHAGTLDPFASGLLIICAGRAATKMIPMMMAGEKEYLATLRLGVETTTQDPEGEIIARRAVPHLPENVIDDCLDRFVGEQLQTPPQFSALKHKGKPLYYYARKGIEIKKEPRKIVVKSIDRLVSAETMGMGDLLELRIVCSKGTYIRTLAADIGKALGCGAYLCQLRRTRSGPFLVEKSFNGNNFTDSDARSRLLAGLLSPEEVGKMLQ